MNIESINMRFILPKDKVDLIRKLSQEILNKNFVQLRLLSSLLGHLIFASPSIPFAQAHYRSLQSFIIKKGGNLKILVQPSAEVLKELSWWVNNLQKINGRNFLKSEPELVIYSDASLTGWGATCNEVAIGGPWDQAQTNLHINELELKAAFNALISSDSISDFCIQYIVLYTVHVRCNCTVECNSRDVVTGRFAWLLSGVSSQCHGMFHCRIAGWDFLCQFR